MRNNMQVKRFFTEFNDKGDQQFRRIMGGIVLTGAALSTGLYLKKWSDPPPEVEDTPDYIEALLTVKALMNDRKDIKPRKRKILDG